MDWARQGPHWPNNESSKFHAVRPHRWHVQEAGEGPTVLLLHGAGGANQSWRGVLPLLARTHHVIAPDLPGQGFTRPGARQRLGLGHMAEDLWHLCDARGWMPDAIVGHSAGGAVALQMALTRGARPGPRLVIGLNAALGPFDGIAGWLFPAMAKLLSVTPFIPNLFARMSGNEARVGELLRSTGSNIDAEGARLYRMLAGDAGHVDGTLAMMAQWRIEPLLAALPKLDLPVHLIVGDADATVPPRVSQTAAQRLPQGDVITLPGLGHLAHEEAPELVASQIATLLRQTA
jgi:magnesium chelatase accessory protein